MRFWDSSAVVPLLVWQTPTTELKKLLQEDSVQVVSWTTHCECFSALARLEREGLLPLREFEQAHKRLLELSKSWQILVPGQELIDETKRVLRSHPLRCADALQLACAVLASGKTPSMLDFVTLDDRLAAAASREGFVLTLLPQA